MGQGRAADKLPVMPSNAVENPNAMHVGPNVVGARPHSDAGEPVAAGALELVDRLGGCTKALTNFVTAVPSSRLTSAEGEAVLLRDHVGICGKLREARRNCVGLRLASFAVAPSEKIFVSPATVPTLLSTKGLQTVGSSSAVHAAQIKCATGMAAEHNLLCEALADRVSATSDRVLSGRPKQNEGVSRHPVEAAAAVVQPHLATKLVATARRGPY